MTSRDRLRVKRRLARARRDLLLAIAEFTDLISDFGESHPEHAEAIALSGELTWQIVDNIETIWRSAFGELPADWASYSQYE